MLNMITAGALQQHRRCVRARCGSRWLGMHHVPSNFPNRYYALRGYNNKFPSRLYHDPATPPPANDTTSKRTLKLWHYGRAFLSNTSSPTFVPNSSPNGWRQRYALTPGRAIGPWKANCDAGKTGGKTGGKGDSHVKTTKSHSAKAGLQVSHCRVPSSPRPAHPGFDSCQSYDALTLPLHYSSLAVA